MLTTRGRARWKMRPLNDEDAKDTTTTTIQVFNCGRGHTATAVETARRPHEGDSILVKWMDTIRRWGFTKRSVEWWRARRRWHLCWCVLLQVLWYVANLWVPEWIWNRCAEWFNLEVRFPLVCLYLHSNASKSFQYPVFLLQSKKKTDLPTEERRSLCSYNIQYSTLN